MPAFSRRLLGFVILVGTIGLATCQSMVKAEPPVGSSSSSAVLLIARAQAEK